MDRTPSFRLVHPLLAVLIVTLVVTPARAQAPVPGLTVTALGGGSIDGNLTEGLQVNTKLEPGWIAGLQVEHYFGSGLLGVRLDGLYTVRTVEDGTGKFDVFGLGQRR